MMLQTSASQHNTWAICQRKWGLEKIDGLREPESEPLLFGSILHYLVESWLLDKKPFPITDTDRAHAIRGFLASQNNEGVLSQGGQAYYHKLFNQASELSSVGVHLLPEPQGKDLVVEGNIEILTAAGRYRGARDWTTKCEKTHLDVIGDNKTTSGKKWALTPETIGDNVQAIIYAEEYFRKHPEATHVILRWVYFLKKGRPKAWAVELIVDRETIHAKFSGDIEANTAAMRDAKLRCKTGNDLPPRLSGCRAFHKTCYFQTTGACQISDSERLAAIMTTAKPQLSPGDLLAQLQRGSAVNPPAQAAPAPLVAPVIAGVPAAPEVALPPGPPPMPLPANAGLPPAPQQAPMPQQVAPVMAPPVAPMPQVVAQVAVAAPLPPVAQVAPPVIAQVMSPTVAQVAPPGVAPTEKKTRNKKFILYIDCVPNRTHEYAHENPDLIALAKQTAAALGVVHYRTADFGKGPPTFAALVEAWLLDNPQSGSLVIDTKSSLGVDLIDSLSAVAATVVRGLK